METSTSLLIDSTRPAGARAHTGTVNSELSMPEASTAGQPDSKALEARGAGALGAAGVSAASGARQSAGAATRVVAIARNTFREAVRDRVLYNLVLFVLILTGAAVFLGELSAAQEPKIIVDM